MTPRTWLLLAAAFAASLPGAAADEVFVLRSGGRVEGDWLNRDQSPRETFVMRTDLGTLTFDRDQVAKVVYRSPEEVEYLQRRHTVPDTVEAHEQMVAWCLERRLDVRRRQHLERIIELDPDHEAARISLGYRKISGEWLTRDEEMASRGMVLYQGRYRTTQEIEIWEREKKETLAQREWYGKIKRWRTWMSKGKVAEATKSFREINDPYAVPPLAALLADERYPELKKLYLEVLAGIDSGSAVQVLVNTSLTDLDPEIRLECLDHLQKHKPPLAQKMYIQALGDKDNLKVNRAADGLRSLGNDQAVLPLIDALVTEHKYVVSSGAPPGQTSTSFSPGGGGGMTFGSKAPQVFTRNLPNERVHSALVALTGGKSFGYDTKAWKNWYTSQRKSPSFNSRRD